MYSMLFMSDERLCMYDRRAEELNTISQSMQEESCSDGRQ